MIGFGPNEWLVDELYQAYLADPESVDRAWWDFFADYQPADVTLAKAIGKPPPRAADDGPNGASAAQTEKAATPDATADAPSPSRVRARRRSSAAGTEPAGSGRRDQ